jgi:hypothetical protein
MTDGQQCVRKETPTLTNTDEGRMMRTCFLFTFLTKTARVGTSKAGGALVTAADVVDQEYRQIGELLLYESTSLGSQVISGTTQGRTWKPLVLIVSRPTNSMRNAKPHLLGEKQMMNINHVSHDDVEKQRSARFALAILRMVMGMLFISVFFENLGGSIPRFLFGNFVKKFPRAH